MKAALAKELVQEGSGPSAADMTNKANVLRFKAVVTTEALMAEMEASEGEKRLQELRNRRPLEALLADALTKRKLLAAPQLMKAWAGQKQNITCRDFVANVLALGIEWPEAELQALFSRMNTGKTGLLGSEELRAGLRKMQEIATASDQSLEEEVRSCAELRQRAERKGDEANAAALDVTVLTRQQQEGGAKARDEKESKEDGARGGAASPAGSRAADKADKAAAREAGKGAGKEAGAKRDGSPSKGKRSGRTKSVSE